MYMNFFSKYAENTEDKLQFSGFNIALALKIFLK